MQRVFLIFFACVLLLISVSPATAAKKKPAAAGASVSATYNKTKNIVRASFGNLKGIKSVSYTLFYQANGVGQGVVGTLTPGKKTALSKDLYLGTCSSKVCTKHKNIKNLQLEVKTKFTNGKSTTKIYKVK